MPQPSTRKEQKAKTEKALVAAARRCFERDGYKSTSIGAITREAGVAHGTFYVHFKTKDALLEQLLAEFNDGLVTRLAPIWSSPDIAAIPDQIRASADVFLGYWLNRRSFVETYGQKVGEGISLTDLQTGFAAPVAVLLTLQLTQLGEQLDTPLPHAGLVVHSLLAMWARVGLHHLAEGGIERATAVDLLTRMTLGLLRGVLPTVGEHWAPAAG